MKGQRLNCTIMMSHNNFKHRNKQSRPQTRLSCTCFDSLSSLPDPSYIAFPIHTHIHTYTHTHKHIHTHILHTYIHTHTHTHTHTDTHTHNIIPLSSNECERDTQVYITNSEHARYQLVSVPDPKPTPPWIAFSIARVILEAIYAPDEV